MGLVSRILRSWSTSDDSQAGYTFWCPGCDMAHKIWTSGPTSWDFNGNLEKPTFSPSLMCHWPDPDKQGADRTCHSFIRAGEIQFLGDCTHALAGQTVPIPDWPSSRIDWSDNGDN